MIVTFAITVLLMAGGVVPGIPVAANRVSPATPIIHEMVVEPTYDAAGNIATAGAVPPSETMDRVRLSYIMDYLEAREAEAKRVEVESRRAVAVESLASYMRQAGFLPELVNMAPLMVELGEVHGVDPRLCAVTITAESSGGRGSYNLFGSLAGACGDLETQVRWYFRRVQEIGVQYGYTGDNWRLAWYWYGGGSSMGGKAESYADNVAGTVQTIGGFGGGGSSAK